MVIVSPFHIYLDLKSLDFHFWGIQEVQFMETLANVEI
jgi:hypothetical protein